jgi:hypothetical protein
MQLAPRALVQGAPRALGRLSIGSNPPRTTLPVSGSPGFPSEPTRGPQTVA